jgi:hypothetical protein
MPKSIRKLILPLTLLALIVPAISADAAPIRECGNMPNWDVTNLTTRRVSCRDARAMVRTYLRYGGVWNTFAVHRREHLYGNGDVVNDIRIVHRSGRYVVHFQWLVES